MNTKLNAAHWMNYALKLAERAASQGEVPVGAVVVYQDKLIAEGWNQPIALHDPTAHAEIIAIRQAALKMANYRLLDTTLYVTLEPCAMCMGAIIHARIKNLVFAAWDPRAGAVRSVFQLPDNPHLNHRIHWKEGILANESQLLLQQFFQQKRVDI